MSLLDTRDTATPRPSTTHSKTSDDQRPGRRALRIVLAASEAVPFCKTGGLADVVTGLGKALAAAGQDVTLIIPLHVKQTPTALLGSAVAQITVKVGEKQVPARVIEGHIAGSKLRVLLIDAPIYFDRTELYTDKGHDYHDNAERYIFFSRAVIETIRALALEPDVVHANDWQTGLLPALVATDLRKQPTTSKVSSVFTIHNMAFQGRFPWWDMRLTGLSWEYFNWRQMEFFGELNLLKTGIAFSEMTTTVSPTYAKEICTVELGCGLEQALVSRGDKLVGILNGIDPDDWNPATDRHLPAHYNLATVQQGKATCKQALQQELGLPARPDTLLFGIVSRLTDQKGFDLLLSKADDLLKADLQIACLGTGDVRLERQLKELAQHYPTKVAVRFEVNEGLAHRIEAGADAFLMPSRFEPCGLNQLYSLAYGTLPIVHAVGGLADSVVDTNPESIANATATGFTFKKYTPEAFLSAVWRCVGVYLHDRQGWRKIQEQAMAHDRTWNHSAAQYMAIYRKSLSSAK